MSVRSENTNKLYSAFLKLVCVLGASFIIEIISKNFNNEFLSIFSSVFHLIGGSFLTASLMSAPIVEFQKSVIPFLPRIFRSNQRLEDCIYKYKKYKSQMTQETIKIVEKLLIEAEIYESKNSSTEESIIFESLLSKINYILTFYEPIIETQFNVQQIINDYDKISFDNNTKKELIKQVIIPFVSKINNPTDNISLNPIYLLGSPGTGKTKFVNDLAKILDIPVIAGSFDSFKHHPGETKFNENAVHMYVKALHQAIKTRKTRTFILFIDEFDKRLERMSNILYYLNSNNNVIEDECLQISVNIGNILLICAGNKSITQVHKCHIPLDNRFIKINFPKIPNNLKKTIVYNTIKKYENRLNYNEIDQIINKDKLHGIRQLLMDVNTNISNQLGKKLFKGTRWENINNSEKESEESEEESEEESKKVAPKTIRRRARSRSG